ncbi:MAG: hypothetical protein QF473_00700 [Planctomycetota bacterium]|jgi:hypothetical protein|nr:hypothetical protein [Planctomycetota bacterium]MDP6502016.1 hypothetical protein [Planctomycetota bacterium]
MTTQLYDSLRHEISRFGRGRRRLRLVAASSLWITLGLIISGAYVLIDLAFEPGTIPLLVCCGLSALAILILLGAYVLPPLLSRINIEREAVEAELLVGSLRNRLVSALQLAGRSDSEATSALKQNVSPSLIAAVQEQAAEDMREHEPVKLIDRSLATRRAATAIFLVLLTTGLGVWRFDVISERYHRLRQALVSLSDMLWPVVAQVSPGNKTVLRGSQIVLALDLKGRSFESTTLQRSTVKKKESSPLPAKVLPLKAGNAKLETEQLDETFDYWFEYGERKTETYRLRVVDRPAIERVRVDLDYPPYTKRLPRTFMGRVPVIRALEGTRVTLSVTYNKDIANAEANWDNGAKEYWDVAGRYVGAEFIVDNTDAVVMQAECVDGYKVTQPLRFSVIAEKDERPEVAAHVKTSREGSIMLSAEQLPNFSVGFTATDDFGVSAVELFYEKGSTDIDLETVEVKDSIPMLLQPARDRVVGVFKKCFANLNVQPGDKITFYLQAKDNRESEDGQPNIGRSPRKYTIIIYQPSLTGFLDSKVDGWQKRMRLWGAVERAGRRRLIGLPPTTRRVSKSPKSEKREVSSFVARERIPGANQKAEAQFRKLLSKWQNESEKEEE